MSARHTLLDVVVDEALLLDLARLLRDYRNAPDLDLSLNTFEAALRLEKRLTSEAVKAVVMLLGRRRADALDSDLIDAVDRLQLAHTAMHERMGSDPSALSPQPSAFPQ